MNSLHRVLSHLRSSRNPILTRQLHAQLLKSNLIFTNSSNLPLLLSSYSFSDARHLLDEIPHSLFFSSPILFSRLLSHIISPPLSLHLFRRFLSHSPLDHFLFASLAHLASLLPSLPLGRQAHAQLLLSPHRSDDVSKSSFVSMYCKCGSLKDARKVFDTILHKNVVSHTAMISGYASSGQKAEAMKMFERMEDKSVLTWTALISGFVQSGNAFDGTEMFVWMRREGVEIEDAFVLSSVISAAADMAALELGRQMHCEVVKLGYELSGIVGNSIVDMYAKCSDVCSARAWFERVPVRDVVSWTTMIVGEAQHGRVEEALGLFEGMVRAGVRPNEVTFVGLLYACSHSGLVQRGREIFDLMVNKYKIRPLLLHYTCLLDLLSRSGLLEDAESVIREMPCEPDEASWAALLSACKKHGNQELSLRFADHLLSLRPREPSTYILLSNVYAAQQKWDSVANVRKLMVDMEFKKEGGYSWIEMGKDSCTFWAGEVPHHMSVEILGLLRELGTEMRKKGYIPDTSSVMHDLDEQEKVQQLSLHSERLAIAFGLLRSIPGSIIRVVKNIRVCGDCHTVLKLISEIAGREFVVRDAKRFHHFKGGKCSCGDFW